MWMIYPYLPIYHDHPQSTVITPLIPSPNPSLLNTSASSWDPPTIRPFSNGMAHGVQPRGASSENWCFFDGWNYRSWLAITFCGHSWAQHHSAIIRVNDVRLFSHCLRVGVDMIWRKMYATQCHTYHTPTWCHSHSAGWGIDLQITQ